MVIGNDRPIEFSTLKTESIPQKEAAKEALAVLSLSDNAIGFIATDEHRKQVLLLGQYKKQGGGLINLTPAELDRLLNTLPLSLDHFGELKVIFDYPKCSLCPGALFAEGESQTILSYNARLEAGEAVINDHWKEGPVIAIHAAPGQWVQWLQERYPHAQKMHQATALHRLSQHYQSEAIYAHLHVSRHHADFYLGRQGKVLFYNQFPFDVAQDLLYYVLYVFEQYRLLATEITIHLSGQSQSGDKLFELLGRYISEVKSLKLPGNLNPGAQISKKDLRENLQMLGAL